MPRADARPAATVPQPRPPAESALGRDVAVSSLRLARRLVSPGHVRRTEKPLQFGVCGKSVSLSSPRRPQVWRGDASPGATVLWAGCGQLLEAFGYAGGRSWPSPRGKRPRPGATSAAPRTRSRRLASTRAPSAGRRSVPTASARPAAPTRAARSSRSASGPRSQVPARRCPPRSRRLQICTLPRPRSRR